jgi:nucleotide-binding universal stress UspA family protein
VTLPQESSRVVIGRRASTLLLAAEAYGADLLVIGTHGRQGLNRWLSGSVAEDVVRNAGMPVLVIREASVTGDEVQPEWPERKASPVG